MNRRDALRKTGLLAGSAMAAPSLFSILQSCSQTPRLGWTPQFLSENQAQFISSFVDTILPKTETPGALDVKTDMFLDMVYAKTYGTEAQANVKEGIDQLNNEAKEEFGKYFSELGKEEKSKFLQGQEAKSETFNRGVWGTSVGEQKPVSFYRQLKSQALWGYFSSEEVGKNILNYDPIPGEFLGCVPVSEIGKVWSL
ncbi:gluconate 2-dehydrogenase subunit 3 family protein [Algoriphagus sp.]|uniref:gluconate 2-dehydrogenase subunit 3 family protein n=1 Tax=Algoriphagus sp. TaxID=1872435 RepID=UPI003278F817